MTPPVAASFPSSESAPILVVVGLMKKKMQRICCVNISEKAKLTTSKCHIVFIEIGHIVFIEIGHIVFIEIGDKKFCNTITEAKAN